MSGDSHQTVEDLHRAGRDLLAECGECGHRAELRAAALLHHCRRHGMSTVLAQLAPHLRCHLCSARNVALHPF